MYKYENQFLHAHKIKFEQLDGILSNLSNKEIVAPLGEKEKNIIYELRKRKEK